jgi:ParB family transcriptional regulator, chromosome partitioning protein
MKPFEVDGIDVAVESLKPLNERPNINTEKHRGYRRIISSMRKVGLIEPLCIYREGDSYIILDGYLRWLACTELGYETVPCILYKDKEAYTYNRMVNNLSGFQEMKMMRKSLESLDEQTIADTFGLKNIRYRLAPTLVQQLHPSVAQAFEKELMGKTAALEMLCVKPERQAVMLREMKRVNDFTPAFIRALILKTPPELREPNRNPRRNRKKQERDKRLELVDRLEEAEKQHEFYTGLYRQYTADLLKISLYARKLITTPAVREYFETQHPSAFGDISEIVMESQ